MLLIDIYIWYRPVSAHLLQNCVHKLAVWFDVQLICFEFDLFLGEEGFGHFGEGAVWFAEDHDLVLGDEGLDFGFH